jgi:magnesium transporter
LKHIDRTSSRIEQDLHKSQRNKELLQMMKLQKSLVYFSTSLKSNEVVLEKLMKHEHIKMYPEDTELLEDAIIENRQAIEMANIYSSILTGTMDAFASIISNNLNIVMKFLASVTIVMAIPTMISGFFGMNVPLPLSGPYSFWIIVFLSLAICVITGFTFIRKKMF